MILIKAWRAFSSQIINDNRIYLMVIFQTTKDGIKAFFSATPYKCRMILIETISVCFEKRIVVLKYMFSIAFI